MFTKKNKKRKFSVGLILLISIFVFTGSMLFAYDTWRVTLNRARGKTYIYEDIRKSNNTVQTQIRKMGGGYTRMYFLTYSDGKAGESTVVSVLETDSYGNILADQENLYSHIPNEYNPSTGKKLYLYGGNDKWSLVNVTANGRVKMP